MSFSAVIVTRGDVALDSILDSLKELTDDTVVWDNSKREDLAVYGRYAAIAEATHPLIYVQDDDVLHKPEGIEEIVWQSDHGSAEYGRLIVNMPANFRHSFYQEHALVGFGSCFHRDLPKRAFQRWDNSGVPIGVSGLKEEMDWFRRTCDILFTGLTPYTMVDLPYEDLPWAEAENRMWKQPTHVEERARMLELVKRIRDS